LDERTTAEVEDLICEHSLIYSREAIGFTDLTAEEITAFQPVRQRLVRTHPATGRKSLFLSSHAGTIVGWTIAEARMFLRDLTEQVATQRRLIQREKLASLGEMAAGVAHEIRNPLGGIKMATNLLSSGAIDDKRISQEMAHSIMSGIAEIETIIADLLDYARETRLDRQEYALHRVLAPVVEACAAEAAERGVRVEVQALDDHVVASVDGPRLRQVFANVMKNAVEAAERKPDASVTVSLYRRQTAAVIEIADNGVGIEPEHREKIFLPFYTTKPTGTGLGMAIVKKIMDLHGGEIDIESVPGRRTTVRLVIPRSPVSAAVEVG